MKPLLWENTFKLPLEDVYTRLSIVSRGKTDFRLQSNKVDIYNIFGPFFEREDLQLGSKEVNVYDVFKPLDKCQDAMVLVEGSPGIGKSTFCLKIAYDWTNEKIPEEFSFPVFELVLLLKCRDIHGDTCIMEAISEQLLPEDVDEQVKKKVMDYIKDIHNQEKILIILDGLDELPKTAENHVEKLLHRRILPFCYVLATTRQERGIVVRQQVNFDVLLQIEGFTEEDYFEYIRKHFRHFGPEHLSKGENLIKAIRENTFLHGLPSNPLNLLLLCVVFEQYEGKLPSFRTELYQIIVRCLLRRYCAKYNLEAPDDDKVLEKEFEDSLLALGELAWRCLLKDLHSFCEEELARFESNNKDLAARKLGLVFKEASVKRINPQHEYHFFHKTFQEYLAALYLAHKILEEQLNVFRDCELHFFEHTVLKYRQVFLFVSGILGKDAAVLFGQIGETLKSGGWDWLKCCNEVATFFTESFSESRNAEQTAITLCSFIPFPLTVDIDASIEPVNLNILMVANACANFSKLQHPVHLTVANVFGLENYGFGKVSSVVADFLTSSPKLETLRLSSFALISSDAAVHIGNSLAANKTLTTVTFELIDELSEAWATALKTALSPLPSVVLKIYGSMSDTAVQALKNVLQNRSLISLELIIYGDMTDSQATAVGEGLAKETILKSLTLIVYGKVSCSAAIFLKAGVLENTSLNFLEVKVFGELPDNWVTVVENVLMAKRSIMSVTVDPYIIGNITDEEVASFGPFFEENSLNVKLQSLTLNLWGKLSCDGAEALCKLLIEFSTSHVTLNIHGTVTDAVADRFLRCLKVCKTLSSLCINIWGELTRRGNSVLRELSCNGTYFFELNSCAVTSDDSICNELCSTIDVSSSSASVLETIKDTSKSKLSFDITDRGGMSGDWAHVHWGRGLGDGLAKNTSLTTLSLTFNNYRDLIVAWGYGLGDGLAKNASLITLSLTFNNYRHVIGSWGHGLGDGLAKNTSLTTLSLTFNNYRDVIGAWGHGLGDGLAKNTSLTTLRLAFNNYRHVRGDWGRGLGDGLAKNTSLTTLSLTFNNYVDMIGDWEHVLRDGLAKNTSLTTLSLTFSNYNDLSGDWGRSLGDGLAKNQSLTTLCLTFNIYSDLIEDWGLGLDDGLAKNTSLTTLSLTFNIYCDLSGDWGRGLNDGLAKNQSLTTLSLTFNNFVNMIGDWEHVLGDGLAKNTSLTTLSLTVNNYNDLSGDWGRGLGDGLAKNQSLTALSLTFNIYSDLSGDWGLGLDDGLAKTQSLTTLSLTFNIYSDLSGDWAHGLGDGLAKNQSLTTLSLTFNSYRNLSTDCLHYLWDSLAKSVSKVNLSVTINDHSGTSKLLGCDLRKRLSDCKSLTSLNLIVSLYGEATVC